MYTHDSWFKDDKGRTLILRGANLSASTKVPYTPDGATYRSDGFFDHRNVSFIGKPFPLEDADEHLSRLKTWGLTFLRFLTTWEAVEHAGPGQYDADYLDYLHTVVSKANDYGITCFIDPHQDVWSRWTGGDGAPGWTLEAVGFDLEKLHMAGAAISHQTHGDPFPRMIWPTNYTKLGAATMFTLFFGGDTFAPRTKINGVPVQEYLQSHYINAMKQVALKLKDLPNVVGFDSLNEPSGGFIGMPVDSLGEALLHSGTSPTPYQAMLAGAGYPQTAEVWDMGMSGPEQIGETVINPEGVSVWRDGYECVWKQNGVWTDADGKPVLLRSDHFNVGQADVANDYIKPFIERYIEEMRTVRSDYIMFIEGAPGGDHPEWHADDPDQVVNASHWYDVITLFLKMFNPEMNVNFMTQDFVEGKDAVQQMFNQQLAANKQTAQEHMNNIPTLIGEFGMPFDLDSKSAYKNNDFSIHAVAMDMYFDAMDANLLNCTVWNYTPDNTNAHGDLWNDEDLSIFSRDQQDTPEDIHSGGRGLPGIVRPYARATAGTPVSMEFELETKTFEYTFENDPTVNAPTEIFVPGYQYPDGIHAEVSDDSAFTYDEETQILSLPPSDTTGQRTVKITSA